MKKSTVVRETPTGVALKRPAKKTASLGRAAPISKKTLARPAGYSVIPGTKVLAPESALRKLPGPGVVPASKLQNGIAKARQQISGVLQELIEATRDGYEITEIELAASFNADGKFLGFGVGGEMSISFKVRPVAEA